MQNKKILLAVFLSLALLLVLPMMSAATAIVKPVTNTNYTGTVNVTATTALSDIGEFQNLTCWYDPLGGTAYVYWFQITNTSAAQHWYSNPTVSISALADKLTYKVICGIQNGTASFDENSSAVTNIGFDNTAPVVTLGVTNEKLNAGNTQEITWTSSDATSGLASTSVTVTSSDTDKCPVQTWTTATGTNVQIATDGGVASCTGTWTVVITATDTAGNVGTSTETFIMKDVAGKRIGVLGSTLTEAQQDKKGISPIVLIIAGIIIYFLFFSKKKGK